MRFVGSPSILLLGCLCACGPGSGTIAVDPAAPTITPAPQPTWPTTTTPAGTTPAGTTPTGATTDTGTGPGTGTATGTGTTTSPTGTTTTTDIGGAVPDLAVVPPGGTFFGLVEVELVTSDDDAVIWYTLDGRPPEPGVANRYTDPILLDRSATVRVLAEYSFGQTSSAAPTFLNVEPDLVGFSSDLPVVVAWSTDRAPTEKSEFYDTFSLTVFEPEADRVVLPTHASLSVRSGLRVRGSSSAWYPKKPYRIETWNALTDDDMDVALLGMPEEADWVFLAPLSFDRALMRNALIYELSNQVGRYASRTRFVELFVAEHGEDVGADDYVGVYVVVERIERDAERVQITKLEPTDLTLPELSGGYLFKEDRTGPGEWGFTAGTADGLFVFEQPFVHVDPEERTIPEPQARYLTGQLDELGYALASPDFRNPYTGRHYADIIDVDSWIDHHILNVFTKNPDAFRLSGYFHKDREGPIHAGPIWDFDRTMGCDADSRAADPTWWDNSNETWDCTFVFEHGFWPGLFADPVFRELYFSRMEELLAGPLSRASVLAVVDDMADALAEAAPRNFDRWPDYPPRDGGFAGEVAILEAWISDRHAWMTGCLALPDPRECTGR